MIRDIRRWQSREGSKRGLGRVGWSSTRAGQGVEEEEDEEEDIGPMELVSLCC